MGGQKHPKKDKNASRKYRKNKEEDLKAGLTVLTAIIEFSTQCGG